MPGRRDAEMHPLPAAEKDEQVVVRVLHAPGVAHLRYRVIR